MEDAKARSQQTPPESKGGLGCLLAALLAGALVSGFFTLITITALVIRLAGLTPTEAFPGSEDDEISWFTFVSLLIFLLPMFTLFARGVVVTIRRLRGRQTARLVTSGIATMLALAYGVPGVVSLVALAVLAPDRVSLGTMISGAFAIAFLLAAPLLLRKLHRSRSASEETSGDR